MPCGTTLNAEVRCDGKATFKTSRQKDGKELATEEWVQNSSGPRPCRWHPHGNLNTNSLIKSTRKGRCLRSSLTTTQRAVWNTSGRIDITMADQGVAGIRVHGSINVKANGQEIGGRIYFCTRITSASTRRLHF